MIDRRGLTALCGLLLCTALPGVAITAERVLHRAGTDDPTTIDPHKFAYPGESTIVSDLFVGLAALDAEAKAVPGCAESWRISADGKSWTFKLRPGLKWSDGTAMQAADFTWSMRRALDPATAFPFAGRMFAIKNARAVATGAQPVAELGVSAPDARTVVIELEHPTPYLAEVLATFGLPAPRARVEKYGSDWIRPENFASNGPFIVERWSPNSSMRLKKNPHFFDAANVKLDAVIHYPVSQPMTAMRRFAAGEFDFTLAVPPDQLDWARRNVPKALRVSQGLGVEVLAFNLRVGPTRDLRVRRALSMALDREALARSILGDVRLAAWNYVPPVTSNYGPGALPEFHDWPLVRRRAEARRLLEEAGYGPGKPLTLRLAFPANEFNKRIAVVLDAMWRQIGVRASLEMKEQRSLAASIVSGDFDSVRQLWLGGYSDALAFLDRLDGAAVGTAVNAAGYANPRLDALLRRAEQEIDIKKRAALLREAETLAVADQPVMPIYFFVSRRLVSPQLTGWTDNPRGIHVSRYMSVPAR
ncbi:MAG TPA: peptide ABC transporter substrate-binding protein [Steroidobacteraceae bacterium]|nr:peptide ABC transporter substrate-binding protein [Steroidobacteraceae bacterium]HRX90893.1 peptide ABC transporter substrate-binding protein [Steroidobacteraceae bacterium]